MGSKASHFYQSDRPESGGADKDMLREKSGLPDRDQAKFAQQQSEMKSEELPEQPESTAAFSIDNPPNSDPRKK